MGPAGTEKVVFESNRLKLAGVIHWPVAASGRERAPAFLVLHGFGSTKDSNGSVATAQHLATRGYLALRFDFRGCGESEG
ncbi:MAG TPA: alpha/beta hydrolase, partial [Chloroflexota bacterium]|nr:alpha/beta hydrolase [Chloroflexota bacterium]